MPELGFGAQSASTDVCRSSSRLIPLALGFPGSHCGIHTCGAHTAARSREQRSQGHIGQICPVSQCHSWSFVEYCLHKIFYTFPIKNGVAAALKMLPELICQFSFLRLCRKRMFALFSKLFCFLIPRVFWVRKIRFMSLFARIWTLQMSKYLPITRATEKLRLCSSNIKCI